MSKNVIYRTILAIFATYRLARIITTDEITQGIRAEIGRRASGKPKYSPWWLLAGMTSCPDCAGVWLALAGAMLMEPKSFREFVLSWLAIAGGQVWMEYQS